jgi:protein-disulfide isomerase
MLCGVSRNRRLLLLAAAVAAAAIVVIVLVVVGAGGDSKSPATSPQPGATTTTALTELFAGVPQHGDTLGKATAPATLLVFEDPQCPFCREWSLGALPTVIDEFVKTGRVKLAWRGIEIIGANSEPGLRAAYGAAKQNRLWNFVDQLYRRQGGENSGWITDALLREAAGAAGVNAGKMLAAASSAAVTAQLQQAAAEEQQFRVGGTPTFVLVRPPSVPVQLRLSALDPTTFAAALSAALQ